MKPGLGHALLGLAIQGLVAIPVALALRDSTAGTVAGMMAASWFYIGRERKQAEYAAGSSQVSPLTWLPRSLRDIAWPVLATGLVVVALEVLL